MGAPIGPIQQRKPHGQGRQLQLPQVHPKLVSLLATGALDPTKILIQQEPMAGAIEAYETFDGRRPGWIKIELDPAGG